LTGGVIAAAGTDVLFHACLEVAEVVG